MREAVFLSQNQARWQQYDTRPATTPDELAARFVALTDDLAYAQTFYPASAHHGLPQRAGRPAAPVALSTTRLSSRAAWGISGPWRCRWWWPGTSAALAWAAGLFVLFTAAGRAVGGL
ncbi:MAG: hypothetical protein WKG07_10470 [Hymenobacter sp.]